MAEADQVANVHEKGGIFYVVICNYYYKGRLVNGAESEFNTEEEANTYASQVNDKIGSCFTL